MTDPEATQGQNLRWAITVESGPQNERLMPSCQAWAVRRSELPALARLAFLTKTRGVIGAWSPFRA